MATATLLFPKRLNAYGRVWEKGVKETVSDELAEILDQDPRERFKVRFNERGTTTPIAAPVPAEDSTTEAPTGVELLNLIRDAADALDVDDDANFDRHGKPNHHVISEILGIEITPEQRDAAMALAADPTARLQAAADAAGGETGGTPRKGGVRITRASADKKEAALAAAKAREDAEKEGETDPAKTGGDGTEVTVEV